MTNNNTSRDFTDRRIDKLLLELNVVLEEVKENYVKKKYLEDSVEKLLKQYEVKVTKW